MKKPREDPWKKVNGGEMPVSSGGRRTNSDTCSQVTNSSTESNQPSLSNEKKNAIMLHENQQKQKGHMEMVDAGGGEQQPQQQLANTPLAAILAKLSPEQQHAIVSSILQMNASPHSRSAPNSQTGGSMVYGPPPKSGSSSAPSSSVGSSSKGTPLQQPPAGPPPLLPLQMQMNPLMGPLNGGHHHLPHMLPAQMPAAAAYIQCCLNQMMADQKMSQNQFLTFLQLQQQLQQQKSLHAFAAVNQQQQQWLQLHHLFQNAKLQQPNFPSMVHSNNAAQHLPLQTEGMQQQNPVKKRQKKREQQPSAEKAAAKGTVKRRSSCQSQISNATASTLSQPQPASNDSSGGRMQGSENEEKKQKQTWRSDACEVTSAGNSKRMPPKKTRRLSTDNDGCAAVSPPAEGSGSAMLNGGPSCTSSSVPQQHSVSADSISPSSGGSSSPAELEDAGNAYACQWMRCQDEFATDKQFVEHVNEHVRNEQTPHFYCRWSSCKRKEPFSAQYMLSQHVRKHSGEKPYQCEYVDPQGVRCMKRYSRLENKKTHERTHNGERPYKCKHCPKQFTNASDKAKHENRTHKDTKDFHCPVLGCIKQYTDPSSLRKHVFHEHGEPVWKFAKAMKEDKQSKTYGVNIIGVREDGTPYLIPPGTINNNHVQCSSDEDRDVDVEGDEEQQQAMDMMSAGDMGGGWTHGGGGNHDTTGSGTTQHSHQKQFKQEVASPPSGEGVTSTQRATAHHHSAAGQQQGISMAGLHLQHGSHYSNGPTSHQPFRQQQQQHFLQQRAIKLGSPVTQQVGGGRQPPMKMTAKMESLTQQQQRSMPAVAPLSDHRQHFGTEQQFRPPFHHQQIPVRQHFRRNSNQYSALDQFSPEDPKPGATATAAAPIQHFYEPMKPVRMEGYWPAAANNDAYMDNGGVAMFGAAGPMEYGSGGEMVMAVRPAAASAPRQYPSMKGNYCVDIEANDNAAVAGSVAVMGNPPPSAPPQLQPYPADCQQPPTLQLRPLYHYGQHRYQHQQQPMYQNEGTAIATHHGEHASLQQNFYAAQQQHHHPPHYSHLPLPGPARMAAQPHGHGEMGALESEEEEDSSDEGREGDQLSERLFTECKISDKKGNSG